MLWIHLIREYGKSRKKNYKKCTQCANHVANHVDTTWYPRGYHVVRGTTWIPRGSHVVSTWYMPRGISSKIHVVSTWWLRGLFHVDFTTWYPRGFFHVDLTTWRPRGSHIDFETYTVRHKNVVKKVRQKVFKEYTKLYNFKN